MTTKAIQEQELLTAREIAARLKLDTTTVYRMTAAGSLPAVRVGTRTLRYDLAEVTKHLKPTGQTSK